MLIQRFFLSILLFTTTLYSFSIFSKNEESKPIIIKPITIPKSVKEEDNNEILEKLKKETKETFDNAELPKNKVAKEVLDILKKATKHINSKKEKKIKKRRKIFKKKKLNIKKKTVKKRQTINPKKLNIKKTIPKKKKITEKRREVTKKIKTVKKGIILGEQPNIYTLSKEEAKKFHNLEVISESKPFVLEDNPKIKEPKEYKKVQKDIDLNTLPLVETLGIVNISKPFTQ